MATVLIHHRHNLTDSEVKKKVEAVARSVERRHDVRFRWEGGSMKLSADRGVAKGARGTVRLAKRELQIELVLPLALQPVRSLVEGRVKEQLNAMLGAG